MFIEIFILFLILFIIDVISRRLYEKKRKERLINEKKIINRDNNKDTSENQEREFYEGSVVCKEDLGNGFKLIISKKNPGVEEVKRNVKEGNLTFTYYKEKNVIVMLFKFGNLEWIDYSFSIYKTINKTMELEELEENRGFLLDVYLADITENDNIRYEFLEKFQIEDKKSKLLREDILRQKEMDSKDFDINANNIRKNYSNKKLADIANAYDSMIGYVSKGN
ncbi:MAG: hypothetical protein E7E64_04800 [Clostridium celatum]|uniref:hypothetical protein n=1 Tax=Clostridium tertium TaxID=1559 RepID=UPI0029044155|nr:hypothetical protein [Clostridium celatum]